MLINDLPFEIAGLPSDKYFADFLKVGTYSDDMTEFLRKHVRPGWHCFDVGANIGFTSIFLATLASDVKVTAFEPSPTIYQFLHKNISYNNLTGAVVTEQVAASNKTGTVEFTELPGLLAGSYIADVAVAHPSAEGTTKKIVRTRPLDDYCAERKTSRLDLLKIDTEGHEVSVLEGARGIIEKFKPLTVVEFNFWILTYMQQLDAQSFLDPVFSIFPHVGVVDGASGAHKVLRNTVADRKQFVDECNTVHGLVRNLVCSFEAL
jgi:FkbM family methyltransferase